MSFLTSQGFPPGLRDALLHRSTREPLTVWILDNSQKMCPTDAHILQANTYANVPATRWQELADCVMYHADLAYHLQWQTRFALLNPITTTTTTSPRSSIQHFVLHQPSQHADGHLVQPHEQLQILKQALMGVIPQGPTNLLTQLHLLREHIASIATTLRSNQHTVSIIIATQGLLTDDQGQSSPILGQSFIQMIHSFRELPVSFILRLCTDDEQAFEFYNALDAHVAVPLDVLDDFYGESLEVYLRNPWLCYALVLHRFRELGGLGIVILDVLDERSFTLKELHTFLQFLFGTPLPDPRQNWTSFYTHVNRVVAMERSHWNPVLRQVTPWIQMQLLHSMYAPLAAAAQTSQSPSSPPPMYQQSIPSPPTRPTSQQSTLPLAKPVIPLSSHPQNPTQLSKALEETWSKKSSANQPLLPLPELLATIHTTFGLVDTHPYWAKFHPLARDALMGGDANVLKKAVRKIRLLLHPDKLPSDLNQMQQCLCRDLWDVVAQAWDVWQVSHGMK